MNPITTQPQTRTISFGIGTLTITVIVTISGGGTGTYDRSSGTITANMKLFFDFQVQPYDLAADSYFSTSLSTQDGTALDNSGNVVLKGSGNFTEGYLNGQTGTLELSGRITPQP